MKRNTATTKKTAWKKGKERKERKTRNRTNKHKDRIKVIKHITQNKAISQKEARAPRSIENCKYLQICKLLGGPTIIVNISAV